MLSGGAVTSWYCEKEWLTTEVSQGPGRLVPRGW
jgi:hypothetical protein